MENVRRRWFYYCFEWYIQLDSSECDFLAG